MLRRSSEPQHVTLKGEVSFAAEVTAQPALDVPAFCDKATEWSPAENVLFPSQSTAEETVPVRLRGCGRHRQSCSVTTDMAVQRVCAGGVTGQQTSDSQVKAR